MNIYYTLRFVVNDIFHCTAKKLHNFIENEVRKE